MLALAPCARCTCVDAAELIAPTAQPTHDRRRTDQRPARPTRRDSTPRAPGRTCEAQVGFGPRPAGSAALQKTRDYILAELKKAGLDAAAAGLHRENAARRDLDGEPHRHHPRPPAGTHRHRQPLRHQAVPRHPIRRRQRRGIVHGRPARAGARPQGTPERVHDRAAVLRWRGSRRGLGSWRTGNDNTYGSRYYVDAARRGGTLKALRAGPARHDRRQKPRHPARCQLNALAGRYRVGRRRERSAIAASSRTS